jgi:glycosyltransferase involved in cell wall biosynthesis
MQRKLKICYFGTYRSNYMRNNILIHGLREAGHEVVECHETLWASDAERSHTAAGGWTSPAFWLHVIRCYQRLLRQYAQIGNYDVMVVAYIGQFDLFLARILTWIKRKPLVWDILMSLYLIAIERRFRKRSRFPLFLYRWVEWVDCRLADQMISDTPEYIQWMSKTYHISEKRFWMVPIGAEDYLFPATSAESAVNQPGGPFRVVYYGTFIPNHHVAFIIEAARILFEETDILFEMIGDGPDKDMAQALVEKYQLKQVTFPGWMQRAELIERLRNADIVLGSFGRTVNPMITLHNKIYEGLALGKPVICGDSATVRTFLKHGEHVYICGRENPASLANAIKVLRDDPTLRQKIALGGQRYFQKNFTSSKIGALLGQYLVELCSRP